MCNEMQECSTQPLLLVASTNVQRVCLENLLQFQHACPGEHIRVLYIGLSVARLARDTHQIWPYTADNPSSEQV